MQMVYRAKSLSDAQSVRDMLESSGVTAHIASPSDSSRPGSNFISVSVDNVRLDAARRAIAAWREETRSAP